MGLIDKGLRELFSAVGSLLTVASASGTNVQSLSPAYTIHTATNLLTVFAIVAGRDTAGNRAGYAVRAVVDQSGALAVNGTTIYEDAAGWNATITTDADNNLIVQGTGHATNVTTWSATLIVAQCP